MGERNTLSPMSPDYVRNPPAHTAWTQERDPRPGTFVGPILKAGWRNFDVSWRYTHDPSLVGIRIEGRDPEVTSPTVVLIGGDEDDGGFRLVRSDDLAMALLRAWPVLAAPYLRDGSWWSGSFDLDIRGAPVLSATTKDGWLVVGGNGGAIRLESESVLVVECLRAMADHMAAKGGIFAPTLETLWRKTSAGTRLPPLSLHDGFVDGEPVIDSSRDRERLARWYAERLGIDHDLWLRTAMHRLIHLIHTSVDTSALPRPPAGSETRFSWTTDVGRAELRSVLSRIAAERDTTMEAMVDRMVDSEIEFSRSTMYEHDDLRRRLHLCGFPS